jgi:DNA polymerase-3 subunit alpha
MIMPAADYSFNKSHAACYAVIAYQTAFLKANYPIEFNAALLGSVEEETDKLAKFINELKMQ